MGAVDPPNWPGVEWHTFPFKVEHGRTYQFEAILKRKRLLTAGDILIAAKQSATQ